MSELWKQVKRIVKHTKNIIFGMFKRVTSTTTSAVKGVGHAIAGLATFLILVLLILSIGIVAIPFGAFNFGEEVQTDVTSNVSSDNKEEKAGTVHAIFKEKDPSIN